MVIVIVLGVVAVLLISILLYVYRSRQVSDHTQVGNGERAEGITREGDRAPHDTYTASVLTAGAMGVGVSNLGRDDNDDDGEPDGDSSSPEGDGERPSNEPTDSQDGGGFFDRWFGGGGSQDSGSSDGSSGGGWFGGDSGSGGFDGGGSGGGGFDGGGGGGSF